MLSIFNNMIEDYVEVFAEEFSLSNNSFEACLTDLGVVLECC